MTETNGNNLGFWAAVWARIVPHLHSEIVSVAVFFILSAGLVLTALMLRAMRASLIVPGSTIDTIDKMHQAATIAVFALFFLSLVRHVLLLALDRKASGK